MTYFDKNTVKLSHQHMKAHLNKGDTVVDATAGRGRDTLLLSQLVGDGGKVYAFDIQEEAINSTKALLEENGRQNVTLILDSHHKMKDYVKSARAVVFNLGFLPGGDHSIFSHGETSIKAIESALDILEEDGFISVCVYHGGDTGFEERDTVLEYLERLDQKKYTVMLHSFHNRQGYPPLFLVIEKNR
ncbi:MAG: methyltransferase domain-containing protein [Clostridia bacterium]|nr:methyltransferase domain-containing protein [Clostridia bacterium]